MTTRIDDLAHPEKIAPEAWDAYGEAFPGDANPDLFYERFEGHFTSIESFGRNYADRFGDVPDFLAPHIDWRSFALGLEGLEIVERTGAVYVFDVNVV